MTKALLLILIAIVILLQNVRCNMTVKIVYESLDQSSANFFANQFRTSYPILENYIEVKFFPFGQAKVIFYALI